jgi:hypothetical protein
MVSKVDRLRCDGCGIEIPAWAIVELEPAAPSTQRYNIPA